MNDWDVHEVREHCLTVICPFFPTAQSKWTALARLLREDERSGLVSKSLTETCDHLLQVLHSPQLLKVNGHGC